MNIVDICSIVILVLGAIIGFKKGAIKGLVQLVGLIAIVIIAYQFKSNLAKLLMSFLPFYNFGGVFKGLYALNIVLYDGLSFAIIFILLYCILNILINLSGFLDLLVKMTIIFEIPSKILGTIIGVIESLVFVFVGAFVLMQVSYTQKYIMDSKLTLMIVEKTPIVNDVFTKTIESTKNIYDIVINDKESSELEKDVKIVTSLMQAKVYDAKYLQSLINSGKLHMDGVVVAAA